MEMAGHGMRPKKVAAARERAWGGDQKIGALGSAASPTGCVTRGESFPPLGLGFPSCTMNNRLA